MSLAPRAPCCHPGSPQHRAPTTHKPWHHHAVRHSAVLLVIALPLACADGVNVSGGSLGEGVGEGPSSQTNATTVTDTQTGGTSGSATEPMTESMTESMTGVVDGSSDSEGGVSASTSGSGVTTVSDSTSVSGESTSDPTPAVCGDGVVEGTEACDDGGESAMCNADCSAVACGDGVANVLASEDCDAGGAAAACDADCTFVDCGDGSLNAAAGEVCDDGNGNDFDGCGADCTLELLSCQFVNGYSWCYNPAVCGQTCNQVCAVEGLVPVADSAGWLAAQDEPAECLALAQAFGLGDSTSLGAYTYACIESAAGVDGSLIAPLYCSTDGGCPDQHRNNADALGIPCAQGGAFQSMCPCE